MDNQFIETTGDPFADGTPTIEAGASNGGAAPGSPNLFTGNTSTEPMVLPSMIHGLDYAFLQVREFHESFDHPIANEPTPMDRARREIRAKWKREEVQEFEDADGLLDQVDACMDGIYFNLGTLVEMGVIPQAVMDIVHGANMGKKHLIDGEMVVVRNEDGKVVKPSNWHRHFAPEPLIEKELERQEAAGLLHRLGA